jgi:hypothetical protein
MTIPERFTGDTGRSDPEFVREVRERLGDPTIGRPGAGPVGGLEGIVDLNRVLATIDGIPYTYGDLVEVGFLTDDYTYEEFFRETTFKTELAEFLEGSSDEEQDLSPWEQAILEMLTGGDGSRGSRARAAAPIYVKPDTNLVNEAMRNYVVAVTGEQDGELIAGAQRIYLDTDRANFGSTTPLDPGQAAKEFVRGSAKYKDLHELRDPTEDEMDWVTQPIAKLRSAGLSSARAASLGIQQARIGADDEALQMAAEISNVTDTGRLLETQRQRLKAKGRAVLELV